MPRMKKPHVARTSRTDAVVLLKQQYSGALDTPAKHNKAFADVLRAMADAIGAIDDAWVDPEVVVWRHEPGEITAEVPLSPQR